MIDIQETLAGKQLGQLAAALTTICTGGGERSDTRERLLSAAFERFASYGFHGTSIRHLAGDVGITSAGFYSHFSSKEDLLSVALARGYSAYLKAVPLAQDKAPSNYREALRALCARHITFASSHTSAIRLVNDLLRDDLSKLVNQEVASLVRNAQSHLVDLLIELIGHFRAEAGATTDNHASILAEVVLNLCEAHVTSPRPGNHYETAHLTERLDLIECVALNHCDKTH